MKLFNKALIVTSALALTLTGCSSNAENPTANNATQQEQGVAKGEKHPDNINESSKPKETADTEKKKETPKPSEVKKTEKKETQKPEPKKEVTKGSALDAVGKLPVSDNEYSGYKRNEFGASWADINNNGCDTRNDVLSFHMKSVKTSDGCKVSNGILTDSYTLSTMNFSSDRSGGGIDIDHVVALSNGWKSGLANASADTRLKFANDPLNLLPVDAGYNRTKGDKNTAEWIPSSMLKLGGNKFKPTVDCPYVARQVAVKSAYKLNVTTAERKAMQSVLSACPSEPLPTNGSIINHDRPSSGELSVNIQNAKGNTANKAPSTQKETKSTSKPKQAPKPKSSSSKTDPDMGTCGKAKSAGYGPYTSADAEYSFYQDRDKDGVVCE